MLLGSTAPQCWCEHGAVYLVVGVVHAEASLCLRPVV